MPPLTLAQKVVQIVGFIVSNSDNHIFSFVPELFCVAADQ